MSKSTFCILPFIHMQVKPSGQMKPCCRFEFHNKEYRTGPGYVFDEHNLNTSATLSSSQQSELWEDIRQKLLKNEPVGGCSKCYKEESISGFSMRTSENSLRNNELQDKPAYDVSKPIIKYLEMTFGNYCNLKCRTCNADLSSTWWEDENVLVNTGNYPDRFYYLNRQGKKVVNVPFKWEPKDFINVEEIKFTGGEPMVHPDFIKLMDMLIEMDVAKNIKLDVFTNCSWIPGEKYLARLKNFKKINLSLSIDGVGAVNDYIRHPSDWTTVDNATTTWLKLEETNRNSIHIIWNPTINIYNIENIKDMVEWWFAKNNEINANWMMHTVVINKKLNHNELMSAGKFKFNVLQDPGYLSLGLLPQSIKTKAINDIQALVSALDQTNQELTTSILSSFKPGEYNVYLPGSVVLNPTTDKFEEHWFIQEIKVKLKKIIRNLEQTKFNQEDLDKFFMYTADLDRLRNEQFAEVFPELSKAFNEQQ